MLGFDFSASLRTRFLAIELSFSIAFSALCIDIIMDSEDMPNWLYADLASIKLFSKIERIWHTS